MMNENTSGAKESLETLLVQLQDEQSEVRETAAQRLGSLGDIQAVPELSRVLRHDENERVRMWAADALGKLGAVSAVPTLLDALKEDSMVAVRAADALGAMGRSAVDALIRALQADDMRMRFWAASALRWTPTDEAIVPLMSALHDRQAPVRRRAAQTLGGFADKRATEPLIEGLDDPDLEVRDAALTALRRLHERHMVAAEQRKRIATISVGHLSDPNPQVRWSAAAALQQFHDQSAIEPLIQALSDSAINVRSRAAEALGKTSAKEAIDSLLNALKSDDMSKDLGRAIAAALAQIGRPTIPSLVQALTDADADVRYWAATALGYLGAEQALPILADLCLDTGETRTHAQVRTAATRAIKQIRRRPLPS